MKRRLAYWTELLFMVLWGAYVILSVYALAYEWVSFEHWFYGSILWVLLTGWIKQWTRQHVRAGRPTEPAHGWKGSGMGW